MLESASDNRESAATGTPKYFYLKDVIKQITGEEDIDWYSLIQLSYEEGDSNTGLDFEYDLYGQDQPSTITIKLIKDHDIDDHIASETGTAVEKYTLSVFLNPMYDHLPQGLGGDGSLEYHTCTFSLSDYGNAAGTEDSSNNHIINVFAKKLQIYKVDQSENAITNNEAIFKLYREALEGEEDQILAQEDVPSFLPTGKDYILADILTTDSEGKVTTNIDISKLPDNAPYYLVETDAPDGYNLLNGVFEVRAMTDAEANTGIIPQDVWTKVPVTTPPETSNTRWDPYVLSNWEQNATIIVKGDGDLESYAIREGNITYDHNQETNMVKVNYKIRNDAGIALPSTGGPGNTALYFLGIMLTGLAGAGLVMHRKRKTA